MPSIVKDFIKLNLAMIFISTSGVLGRYITMPVFSTIGFRALLAGILLFFFCKWKGQRFEIKKEDRIPILLGGIMMGAHWITYFYALRLSNVAIGMLSLFTYPAITAILEPIILKTKMLGFHLFLCALVLLGVYFLVPDFGLESGTLKAVGFGVFSAFCYAMRNIMLKPKVKTYDGSVLMVFQMVIISVMLLPTLFQVEPALVMDNLWGLVILALVTTAIGHSLFLYSLRNFSTITASILSCAQPIYGIVIGIIVLKEYPEWSTMIGGGIIISSVVAESYRVYLSIKNKRQTA